jgi:hypothetical protein
MQTPSRSSSWDFSKLIQKRKEANIIVALYYSDDEELRELGVTLMQNLIKKYNEKCGTL